MRYIVARLLPLALTLMVSHPFTGIKGW